MEGRIFDIVEFSLHDGPGIRTTVFLKGCPLRCLWCHNPESQSFEKELLVSYKSCTNCGKCAATCPCPAGCTACGACIRACPARLRKVAGEDVDASELALTLKKNLELLEKSGGGITISGGEPLFQPEFCISLMDELACNIALDTSGYAPQDVFTEAIDRASLVLFDVKLMDSAKHLRYTGLDNRLILDNLELLCKSDTPFIIRVPLIGGVNDDEVFARDLSMMIRHAERLVRVDLLPYHRGAPVKYEMLGRPFDPGFDLTAEPQPRVEVFEAYGIRCVNQVGY